ncbi:hypothetical protein EB093_02695 [bacterium]|nr:hypothetical protein [bacterium]
MVQRLTVLTFNIGFCGGWNGLVDGVQPADVVVDRLNSIGALIADSDADVVFLQEVDVRSRRSAYVNQVDFLTKSLGYKYFDFATVWKNSWVPFPITWKISRHFGPVHACNLILSRYPIIYSAHHELPQRSDKGWLYRHFYLTQVLQDCVICLPSQTVRLAHLHLDAFNRDTRCDQLRVALAQFPSQRDTPLIIGGDLNSVGYHPGDLWFPDDPENNYGEDVTLSLLDQAGFKRMRPIHGEGESSLFDFPASGPNRALSQLWSRGTLGTGYAIHPGMASDHCGIFSEFLISGVDHRPGLE